MPLADHEPPTPTPIRGIQPNTGCRLGQAILEMTDGDYQTLTTWLSNPPIQGSHRGYGAAWISYALQAEGFDVSEQMVGRHRRGGCGCGTR